MPSTLPQDLQRASRMLELLAELEDTIRSQLIVTQVQAGEVRVVLQPSS